MSGFRIAPQKETLAHRRAPRERDGAYLEAIRSLGCMICGMPAVAAHVRYADPWFDKPITGKSEKPSDHWALPLCPKHHTDGPDAQHKSGEAEWWRRQGISPLAVCEALSSAYDKGKPSLMLEVVVGFRVAGKSYRRAMKKEKTG